MRKSSLEGNAVAMSISFFSSCSVDFFFRPKREKEDSDSRDGRADAASSLALFLVLNRFIVNVVVDWLNSSG